mgnify:CR=1 FL=1
MNVTYLPFTVRLVKNRSPVSKMHAKFFLALALIFLIQTVQVNGETDIRCHSRGEYNDILNRCNCAGTAYTGIHCQTERSVCQQNECGKATSCDIVNNTATCTCVDAPTGYNWGVSDCKSLRSDSSMPEGNVSTLFSGQDSIEDAKYTITFHINANELCANDTNSNNVVTCNNTLFSTYEKNTTDSTTSGHSLNAFSPDSLITKLNTAGLLNTTVQYEATFNGQKSQLTVTSANFRNVIISAWNLTDLGVNIEVNIALEPCTSNACDGHVAGCTKDEVNTKSICTCKDGWKFSNFSLTNVVCKDRVATTCENNGNYYMNDNVVACDCNHLPEWQGADCNTPTTDCGGLGAHGCMHGSKCEKKLNTTGITDHDNKYTCDCLPGFIGDKCQYNLYNWQTDLTAPYTENFTAIQAVTTSHFWVVFAGKGENQGDDFFFGSNSTDFDRHVNIEAKVCQPDGSCTTFYNGTHEEITHKIHGYYYFEIGVSNITHTALNKTSSVDETIRIDVTVNDNTAAAVLRRAIQTWDEWQDEQKNSTFSPRFAIVAQVAQCETNSCSNQGRCELHYGTTPVCVCENGYEGIRCHLESAKDKDDDFPVWAIVLIATLGGLGVIALLMYIIKGMSGRASGYVLTA